MTILVGVIIFFSLLLLLWFILMVIEINDHLKAIRHDQSLLRHQLDDLLKQGK